MSHAGKVDPLHMLALEVACMAPAQPYQNAHTCYMPWSLVEDIRRALEAKGVNWQAVSGPVRAERQKAQARWMRERIQIRVAAGKLCPDCMGTGGRHFQGCRIQAKRQAAQGG